MPSIAQQRCSTVEYMQQLRNEGKITESIEEFEQSLELKIQDRLRRQQSQRTESNHYEIPVVIHVIHYGEPIGTGANISDAQILSQINVLNKDYNRLNADAGNTPPAFLPVAGSIDIEFILAKQDPSGLPTTGINRVNGNKASWRIDEDAQFKALSYWPSENYMNIWVLNLSGGFIGYAQFPNSNLPGLEGLGGPAETDGVIIDHEAFGSLDDGPFELHPQYNRGRTTTHEVGHFLGLRHIWGDENCGEDYVADTPQQDSETEYCPTQPLSSNCQNTVINKMYQNFLDYTDDACMNLFTKGQVLRIETILDDPSIPRRNSLLSSPGLNDPNCDVNDISITSIQSPGIISCDENAAFKIVIRNRGCSPVSSIDVAYRINEGSLLNATLSLVPTLPINGTSTITIPSVNFLEGINHVEVSVTKVNNLPDENSINSTLSSFIQIDKSSDYIPLREKFDVLGWPLVSTQGGIEWEVFTTNFGASASVQAFNQGTPGNQMWLATPVLDLQSTTKASLFFDLSYAFSGKYDRFQIFGSSNCGSTYDPIPLYDKSGLSLANEISFTSWAPQSESDWSLSNFINLNNYAGQNNVRLAFVFTNATGNNLYLDNIEFFISDNPNPVDVGAELYSVYWSNSFEPSITFNLPERMTVRVQIIDLIGRVYADEMIPDILNQTYTLTSNLSSSGIYFLRLQIGGQFFTTKYYISR